MTLVTQSANRETEETGIKPTTAHFIEISKDAIIKVRSNNEQVIKLIKMKVPTKALKEFYNNEYALTCFSVY
ncbi:hypothetical protein [Vulcanisaeta moutnovskia]|uniref:hypothetical protein n=1 Tax=Vulcanisaeta moutnovskia TaxID=985052 RepID=UPI00064F04D2|nr:hypothetical protein [Vulcanisaeta moutnovskia]